MSDNQADWRIETVQAVLEVPKLNYIDGDVELLSKTLEAEDLKRMKALPRPGETTTPRPKTPWSYEKSFFV